MVAASLVRWGEQYHVQTRPFCLSFINKITARRALRNVPKVLTKYLLLSAPTSLESTGKYRGRDYTSRAHVNSNISGSIHGTILYLVLETCYQPKKQRAAEKKASR